MSSVYEKRGWLYVSYKDASGRWRNAATKLPKGQEKKAQKIADQLDAMVATGLAAGAAAGAPVTFRMWAEKWTKEQREAGVATADESLRRLEQHIYPALGSLTFPELRPRVVRAAVRALRNRKSRRGGPLAARSIWNVYAALHSCLEAAVAEELLEANPCVLRPGDLPARVDADPEWRDTAVFTHAEIEALISDERIPEDRRVVYALLFFTGPRFGEAAALRWRSYQADVEPLGKLTYSRSYSTRRKEIGGLKTARKGVAVRVAPVHPTLAKILAEWKVGGWARLMKRNPTDEDLVVPSRKGECRSVNHGLKKLHQDLERIGLRGRRQHDFRRTFLSLAQDDGADESKLRRITHPSKKAGDQVALYTTLAWRTLCAEVAKLRVEVREGRVLELPRAAVGAAPGDGLPPPGRAAAGPIAAVEAVGGEADARALPTRLPTRAVGGGPERENPRKSEDLRGLLLAGCTGLEPVASGVTGRRYNRLN